MASPCSTELLQGIQGLTNECLRWAAECQNEILWSRLADYVCKLPRISSAADKRRADRLSWRAR
jgi:hypothetical protein